MAGRGRPKGFKPEPKYLFTVPISRNSKIQMSNEGVFVYSELKSKGDVWGNNRYFTSANGLFSFLIRNNVKETKNISTIKELAIAMAMSIKKSKEQIAQIDEKLSLVVDGYYKNKDREKVDDE